ncbi:MAG: ABC transporter ATP-binding protein [Bryobacterales bacterium]|nr:ABC transporter ATP-binding protein [Bryobacterales bacterium]
MFETKTAIAVRGAGKIYGEGVSAVTALHPSDLDVHHGEVLVLAGPSGSGKTTLLSIMGGILRATSGSIRIADREIAGLRERDLPAVRLKHIGFIFQGFNLFPALTARENVEVALELHGVTGGAARKKAEALLDEMGLSPKLREYPANLSGGQKQRVAIARALAGDAPILLADEPTAALDSQSGRVVIDLLCRLARQQNRAVVIVTHDPRVLAHADRTVHIADGRIQTSTEETQAA